MSTCVDCDKEMQDNEVTSCTHTTIILGGVPFKRDTLYYDINFRCHDCNIENKKGNIHHYGCDVEQCPKCKGQMLSCGCADNGVALLTESEADKLYGTKFVTCIPQVQLIRLQEIFERITTDFPKSAQDGTLFDLKLSRKTIEILNRLLSWHICDKKCADCRFEQ